MTYNAKTGSFTYSLTGGPIGEAQSCKFFRFWPQTRFLSCHWVPQRKKFSLNYCHIVLSSSCSPRCYPLLDIFIIC